MQSVTVDLIPTGNIPTLHVSQNDVGRTLRVYMTENGEEHRPLYFDVNPMYLDVKPPNSEDFRMPVDFTSGSDYVTFEVTSEMTASAGKCLCKLRKIYDDLGGTQGFGNFVLEVEKAP